MMRNILIATLVIGISGCGMFSTKKEVETVVKVEYVLKLPPVELMKLPPKIEPPKLNDNGEMMQSDIAVWILNQQKRMNELENKIIGIAKYYYPEQ